MFEARQQERKERLTAVPRIKLQCFMQPCAQEPVSYVLETLPDLAVCKSHAMQTLEALREAGFKDAYLKAVSAVNIVHVTPNTERLRVAKAAPEWRLGIPYNEVPECALKQPGETHHRRGLLFITAKLDGAPLELRVCVECLSAMTTSMRHEGYTEIRVTAPKFERVDRDQDAHLPR